jgi:D-serine deaminase-like pyridoxal phosphate-dependent protein
LASDGHGWFAGSAADNRVGLGDKIQLIPGHCDPTYATLRREPGRKRPS